MRDILIRSRLGEIPGLANDRVAIFDRFDPKAGRVVRHFVLIHEATKLMFEPWGWRNQWYIDLVEVRWVDENTLELADLYIDIIVEGNGPTYRIIDVEELADALKDQKIGCHSRTPLPPLGIFGSSPAWWKRFPTRQHQAVFVNRTRLHGGG